MNNRNNLIKELETESGLELNIISLIYNNEVEIEKKDVDKIELFLNKLSYANSILIIHGPGGDSNAGKALAIIFRKKFHKGFWTLVPRITSSAMLYTILISTGVCISKKSVLTPLDPSFYYKGRYLRACIHLNDNSDEELQRKARKHWENTTNFCMKILNTPGSICVHPDSLNLNKLEIIVKTLFIPKTHYSPITYLDLEKMRFEYLLIDEQDSFWKTVQDLISESLAYLSRENKRFVIDTSAKSEEK